MIWGQQQEKLVEIPTEGNTLPLKSSCKQKTLQQLVKKALYTVSAGKYELLLAYMKR